MAVPAEWVGAEYPCQIVKLHSVQENLRADLVLGGDIVHPGDHSSVITLQAMQIRLGWGPEELHHFQASPYPLWPVQKVNQ